MEICRKQIDMPQREAMTAPPEDRLPLHNGESVPNPVGKNKIRVKSYETNGTGKDQVCGTESEQIDQNDMEEIQKLYEANPAAFRKWLSQKAPKDLALRHRHQEMSTKPLASSDLFHRWISYSPTKVGNWMDQRFKQDNRVMRKKLLLAFARTDVKCDSYNSTHFPIFSAVILLCIIKLFQMQLC